MLEVSRAARLAAWGGAALAGEVPVERAVRAVTGDDEPHAVDDPDLLVTAGTELTALLRDLRAAAVPGLLVVLPAPGDVLGLPGPVTFTARAVEAGEAVLTALATPTGRPGDRLSVGLVPQLEPFGSPWEPGFTVSWQVQAVPARRPVAVGSLGEAERALAEALRDATAELARLDVARWREDAAEAVAAVRDGALPVDALPPTAGPRTVRVLATATRLRAIVELAMQDDGAAVSGHEADRRTRALRGLDAVARHAVVAAVNALGEPR